MRRTSFVVVAVAACAIAVGVGCKKKGAVVGSCDRRQDTHPQSVCTDAFDKRIVLDRCDMSQFDTLPAGKTSDKPCDRTGALAGCKDDVGITWQYPSKRVHKVEHVAYLCGGRTLIGVDGAPLVGVAKEATQTDAEADAEASIAQYKSKVEPMLATVEKIAKKLPPPSAKVKVTSEVLEHVLHVHVEDLAVLGETKPLTHRVGGSGNLPTCARMIRKNDIKDVAEPGKALWPCADAKYLVVVRTESMKEPKVVAGENSYVGGRASGDVLVFELAKGTLIGAAPYSAESSRNLDTKWSTFAQDLDKDFDKQLDYAWSAAEEKAAPKKAAKP